MITTYATRGRMLFLSLLLMLLVLYFPKYQCEKKHIELKNNYVEGIVIADKKVLLECTIHLGSQYYTKPLSNGKFLFPYVKEGVYHLFVNHPYYEFNRYQVEVKKKITKNNYKTYVIHIYDFRLPFERSNLITANVIFDKKFIYEFLHPEKTFNVFKLFRSPLFLILLFFLFMFFALPHMQKMSESAREETITESSYKSNFLEAIKS